MLWVGREGRGGGLKGRLGWQGGQNGRVAERACGRVAGSGKRVRQIWLWSGREAERLWQQEHCICVEVESARRLAWKGS